MSHADLESLKIHLDALRERILALQNAQSTFLQLPAELRNHILRFAMYAELVERRDGRSLTSSGGGIVVGGSTTKQTNAIFREPEFFATCRQIRQECLGVWFQDVLAWEEFVDEKDSASASASASLPSTLPNTSAPTAPATASVDVIAPTSPPTPPSKYWKTLSFLDLQKTNILPSPSFLSAQNPEQQQQKGEGRKPSSSSLRLITQVIHCDLSRARAGVEGSTSIVPRKGLVRVQGWRDGGPSLRWWVWY